VRLCRWVRPTGRHTGVRNRRGLPRRLHARQWRLFRCPRPRSGRPVQSPFGRALSDALHSYVLISGGQADLWHLGLRPARLAFVSPMPLLPHHSRQNSATPSEPHVEATQRSRRQTACSIESSHGTVQVDPQSDFSPHLSPRTQATSWQRRWQDGIDWRLWPATRVRICFGLRGTLPRVLCSKEQRILGRGALQGRGHLAPRQKADRCRSRLLRGRDE
jgi:hypothetical protein